MIRSDFHVHTNLSDGKNSLEEMVISAIEKGLETLGFSDHAVTSIDADSCLSSKGTLIYRKEIARLKKKYKGKIEILCGIEKDYDSEDDYMGYDYIIGSVHYLTVGGNVYPVDMSVEATKNCIETVFGGSFDSFAECYYEKLSKIIYKTKADIIGHFDLITKFIDKGISPNFNSSRYISAWKSALNEFKGNAVLEINTGAIARGHRTTPYPNTDILREWKKLGGEIIITGDAHSAQNISGSFDLAKTIAKSAGFERAGFVDKNGNKYTQF